jgi:hypothetical protein
MCLRDRWNLGELILGFHVSFTLSDDDCRNWSIFFKNENETLLQIGCADVFRIQTKQFVFHLF